MAEFKKPKKENNDSKEVVKTPATPLAYRDMRCKVCSSDFAKAVDRMIALGTSHSEIARIFDISRSSIGRHAKNHLNYEEAAVRQIIAREAEEAQADIEEGISGALARRVYIDVAIQKGFESLINNEAPIEVKDVATLIQLKEDLLEEDDPKGLLIDIAQKMSINDQQHYLPIVAISIETTNNVIKSVILTQKLKPLS
jgi:hypothetical protein